MTQKLLMKQLVFTLLLGIAPLLMAQPPITDGEDLTFFPRFTDATLIRYQQLDNSRFSFPTGKVKRVNGIWQAEKERTAEGRLTSLTYRISDRFHVDEVLSFYKTQLASINAQQLYRCEGLSCGNSNKWANIVFAEKRLYGPHTNQRYIVSEYQGGTLSVYLIKRGNKRVYARVDFVEPIATQVQSTVSKNSNWVASLESDGQLRLDEADSLLATTQSVQQLQKLAEWMIRNNKNIYIVVHRYGEQSVEELLHLARTQAEAFSEKLRAEGVGEKHLRRLAVGPLAPEKMGGENRIVLILIGDEGGVNR